MTDRRTLKNQKAKKTCTLLLCTLLGLGLTGCAGADKKTQEEEKNARETVSVALWGNQLLEGYAEYIQQQFPQVEIEFYVAENSTDYYRFLQEKEKLPDILTVRRFSLNDVKNLKDDLLDLSDTELANDFYQSYLRSYTYEDGTVNWLPACAEVDSLILNRTLFEEQQIPVPTDYESFLSACEAFEKAGIRGFRTDYAADYTCMEVLQGLSAAEFTSTEGRSWRQEYESGETNKLSREIWMPAFERLFDFLERTQTAPDDADTTITEVVDEFTAGKLAMFRGTGADVLNYAQAGEQLFEIARRFSVSPGQMLAANDLPEGTETLAAPRRLLVPGG